MKSLTAFGIKCIANINKQDITVTVRAALLCVACDLPAGRKVCGFLGHNAALGCSRCLKKFPGTVGSMNYSGFDRSQWEKRNIIKHRENIKKINSCNTKTGKASLESEYGCRYSCLINLKYFDPIRMLIIDPMHNLFLGSGKHMIKLWLKSGLMTADNFSEIQEFLYCSNRHWPYTKKN